MVEGLLKHHGGPNVRKLAQYILGGVAAQAKAERAKTAERAKSVVGSKGGAVSALAAGLDAAEADRDPTGTLPISSKAAVLKQGRCLVRYKKGKTFGAKTVFLLEHELKLFAVQATDYKQADAVLPLALITAVKKVKHNGGPAVLLQLRPTEFNTVVLQPAGADSEAECEAWLAALLSLAPRFAGFCRLTDPSAPTSGVAMDQPQRLLVLQGDSAPALFSFDPKRWELRRAFPVRKIESMECRGGAVVVHEVATGGAADGQQQAFGYNFDSGARMSKACCLQLSNRQNQLKQRSAKAKAKAKREEADRADAAAKGKAEAEVKAKAKAERKSAIEARRQLVEEEDQLLDEEEALEEMIRREQEKKVDDAKRAEQKRRKEQRKLNRTDTGALEVSPCPLPAPLSLSLSALPLGAFGRGARCRCQQCPPVHNC